MSFSCVSSLSATAAANLECRSCRGRTGMGVTLECCKTMEMHASWLLQGGLRKGETQAHLHICAGRASALRRVHVHHMHPHRLCNVPAGSACAGWTEWVHKESMARTLTSMGRRSRVMRRSATTFDHVLPATLRPAYSQLVQAGFQLTFIRKASLPAHVKQPGVQPPRLLLLLVQAGQRSAPLRPADNLEGVRQQAVVQQHQRAVQHEACK